MNREASGGASMLVMFSAILSAALVEVPPARASQLGKEYV